MNTDIIRNSAVDLVLFTVANPSEFPSLIWDDSLVSYGSLGSKTQDGLSLFVVTVPADSSIYPNLKDTRVLPGGYLKDDETLASAARRVAEERIGPMKLLRLRQLGTFDEPNRDPSGRVLSFAYWAMVNFEEVRKYLGGRDRIGLELVSSQGFMDRFISEFGPLEEYDGVSRFGYRTMPSTKAFRSHEKTLTKSLPWGQILGLDHDDMVFYAWRKLRHAFDSRLDPFSFLGLNPLGREFRLSELQELREVCRGDRIQRDLFKRQMLSSDFIHYSEKRDRSRPGKPANLYTLKRDPNTEDGTEEK